MRSKRLHSAAPLIIAAVLTLAVPACTWDPFAPWDDGDPVLGVVEHFGDPIQVQVPNEVKRGTAFDVEIVTYGGGCVRKGDTRVEVMGRRVLVTPYDIDISGWNSVCTTDIRLFAHKATLRFDTPGPVTIAFQGRRRPQGDLLTIERTVQVR